MTEYAATNIAELTTAIVEITRGFGDSNPWWRGHGCVSWHLVPGLYRRGLANVEHNLNGRFRLMAGARYDKCPGLDDWFGWLFLMQHYRLPTRLLDWSESPLVALFFALEESSTNDDGDSAIWAIAPTKLNLQQLGREAILAPDNSDLRRLSIDAFVRNTQNPDSRILAVLTKQSDLRHLVQQSVFTVHGCNVPIDELTEETPFLDRIRIPAASKGGFRQILALYGISRASLFPDLENLAQELASLKFEVIA